MDNWPSFLHSEGVAAAVGAAVGAAGAAIAAKGSSVVEKGVIFFTVLPVSYFAASWADSIWNLSPGAIGLVGFTSGQLVVPLVKTLISVVSDVAWVKAVIEDKLGVNTKDNLQEEKHD